VLAALLKHEPAFYTDQTDDAASNDPEVGVRVLTRFGDLKNDIRSKPEWGTTFTGAELNAFFRLTFAEEGGLPGVLPDGLTSPRVSIDGDRVRLAARYGTGDWSTVVSVELRAWLVKGETNTVAVELVGMWAGGLPLGTQSMLDSISEAARDSNVVVTWYRHDGHPVGVFRFYADQARPTTQIQRFQIEDGKLTIVGRSLLDASGPPPMIGPDDNE
jgi:hypothetical protein